MGLYTFSKKSWHVRFFKWLFNENPTIRYKTMCPYFWTYVLIFLFLPLILIIKMFGKAGDKFLNWARNYRENRRERLKKSFDKRCANPNLTPEEAYAIWKSKCYDEYYYYLPNDVYNRIMELKEIEGERLASIRAKNSLEKARQKHNMELKITAIKENRILGFVTTILSVLLVGLFLFVVGWLISLIPFEAVDWYRVGKYLLIFLLAVVVAIMIIATIYGLVMYIIKPIFEWFQCRDASKCGFCKGVKTFFKYFLYLFYPIYFIVKGTIKLFRIIGHMIYSTYKKQCPIITWED